MKKTINERKEEIIKSFPKFDNFWVDQLEPFSNSTIATQFSILYKIFRTINKFDPSTITEDDIRNLKKDKDFQKLSNKSKNMYLIVLTKYLKYYDRDDFVKTLKKATKYPVQKRELNKNELINKKELKQILSVLDTKKRAMIMVLYEGALRRKELVNIRFKDVVFEKGLINLWVQESKTKKRNLPLQDSIKYLKDYFSMNEFEPDDLIFKYSTASITVILNRIEKTLKKRYSKWSKHLNPHLFRHSRLTELASSTVNEPQLRKFAGWVGSSQMPEVYFHLDDNDLKNAVFNGTQTKKQIIEQIEPIVCPHCKTKNPPEAITCYKCGNIVNKDKVIVGRLKEREEIDELKKQNEDLHEANELLKIGIEDLRTEVKQMFDELYYRKEVDEEVKKGRDPSEVREDYVVKKQPKSK